MMLELTLNQAVEFMNNYNEKGFDGFFKIRGEDCFILTAREVKENEMEIY